MDRSAGVPDTDAAPRFVRIAGAITMAQGAAAIVVAVVLVIREAAGHKEAAISGYGTAAWFGIIFGGGAGRGAALWFGRRWGRAISLVAQILLLPVSYYLVTSGQAVWSSARVDRDRRSGVVVHAVVGAVAGQRLRAGCAATGTARTRWRRLVRSLRSARACL